MNGRAPQDVLGRPTDPKEFARAVWVVDRSRVAVVLSPFLDALVGRPRTLTLRGLLVAIVINALRRHHVGHLVEVTRVVNGFTESQRLQLGFTRHNPRQTYGRIDRLYLRLCAVLDTDHVAELDGSLGLLDRNWLANSLVRASIPLEMLLSSSWAVDGTDIETWGALHGEVIELDGEDAEIDDELEPSRAPVKRSREPKKKAKVLGIGPDNRARYTADPDARGGRRSATNSRAAGKYVGYELHLAAQTRDVKSTNYVDEISLSDEVPEVVTAMSLVPAASHRGKAVADVLLGAKQAGLPLRDVVVDPGYSILAPSTMHDKLAAQGIHTSFSLTKLQRGPRPFGSEALLTDGQLFSSLLPTELERPPMPPRGAPESVKVEFEEEFNRRARWRWVRHAGPDADGVTRWRCPFYAGRLRNWAFPRSMRRGDLVPLVPVPDGVTQCCAGTISVMPASLPLWQRIPFGTTAWRKSMGRRQAVESVNAALKGGFVDVNRGFVRVFGTTSIIVILAATVVGYNFDRIRSFRAKHRLQDPQDSDSLVTVPSVRATRTKRRKGTWGDLVGPTAKGPPSDP